MSKPFFSALSLLALLGSGLCPSARAQGKAPEPPNVILINLDDVGAAWFPPYARQLKAEDVEEKICKEYAKLHEKEGALDVEKHLEAARRSTPFLDSLAQSGRVFDRCFTTASLCSPSRSGLLTGRYQQRWGAFFLTDVTQAVGIPAEVPLLPQQFQQAGYRCGMIGKWHVGLNDRTLMEKTQKDLAAKGVTLKGKELRKAADEAYGYSSSCAPGHSPLERGFDYYFGYNLDHDHFYESASLWEGNQRVPKRPPGEFLTDLLSQKCVDFIQQSVTEKKRFLLYYAPMSMHGTLLPPPVKYSSQFNTGIKTSDEWAGHLLAVDEGLRKIYQALKANGQEKNTLLVFTADNGQPGNRVPPYNAPYRGGKGTGWLGGFHVPLIISWPAQLTAGVQHELASQADLLVTALDAAGLKPAGEVDGRSLLPIMQGKTKEAPHQAIFGAGVQSTGWSDSYFVPGELELKQTRPENEWALCPYFAWVQQPGSLLMYITTTRKGVYPEFPEGRPAQKLFFNLKTDVKQEKNRFADTPEVKEAASQLKGWLEQTGKPHIKHAEDHQELLEMSR